MFFHTAEQVNMLELNKQIGESKKASQVIFYYVDWLLSTYNPDPPENGTLIKPTVHPCQKRYRDGRPLSMHKTSKKIILIC